MIYYNHIKLDESIRAIAHREYFIVKRNYMNILYDWE